MVNVKGDAPYPDHVQKALIPAFPAPLARRPSPIPFAASTPIACGSLPIPGCMCRAENFALARHIAIRRQSIKKKTALGPKKYENALVYEGRNCRRGPVF